MKTNRLFLIAALLGTVLAGCQKMEDPIENPDVIPSDEKGWSLTVEAQLSVDSKAMDLSGTGNTTKLKSYWKQGEIVAVYFGDELRGTLEVTETKTDPADPAVLHGENINVSGLSVNDNLTLVYPGRTDEKWTYVGQDGSAPDEDGSLNNFDYATATLKVTGLVSSTSTIMASVENNFDFEQAIFRFGFRVGDANAANIAVESISLSSNQNQIVRNRNVSGTSTEYGCISVNTSSTNPSDNLYFMSVRDENTTVDDTFTFYVVGSDDNALYNGDKPIGSSNLGFGRFLSTSKVVVNKTDLTTTSGSVSTAL